MIVRRGWIASAVLAAVLAGSPGSVTAAGMNPGQPATNQPPAVWAVTVAPTTLYSGPGDTNEAFGPIGALAPLQVLDYDGEWAHVYNPRTRGTAYVRSDLLGPGQPPSVYLTMAPPALEEAFDPAARGVLTDAAPLSVYPTPAEEAIDTQVGPSTWLTLTGEVHGEDGARWYRTDAGDYVPADLVFVPDRLDDFAGRWLDVDLSSPARITAYEGGEPVRSFLTIKGAGPRPTPTGVFTILRRVANETMDSSTIGIPRNGPGGYYLTNVLFTQYFLPSGESLHYNYWSSNFGYPGSHGCLGLSYADSAFLWEWAHVGTPLVVHY